MTKVEGLKEFEDKLKLFMQELAKKLIAQSGILTSYNMVVPGGLTLQTLPDKLTTRTGRLLRSILGASGKNWNGRESIKELDLRKFAFNLTVGSKVPYASYHEYGFPAISWLITPKQKAYFWALYYTTKEEKFKYMALSKGLTKKPYKGRAFLNPAKEEIEKNKEEIVREVVIKVFGNV